MIVGRRHTTRWGCLVGTDADTMSGPVLHAGRAPCVVAFHGFTGTTSEIRPPVEKLADRGFAVHAPLLPGHGSNPSKLQDATFDVWVSEMEKEVRAAQARHERFILCGFSLGSLVALDIAARKPAGLMGLILLGNAVTLSPQLSGPLGFVERRGWKLPDWYILKLWSADVRDREQKKRIASYDRDPLRAALEVYRGGRRVEPLLSRIDCPTLVIHGALDRVCPASNATLVADALGTREVKTRVYPRSGHLVAVDVDREEVAEEVSSFVEELARGTMTGR
jgi:carboxylesterase